MRVLLTLNDPCDEPRGAVLRVRNLIEFYDIDTVVVLGKRKINDRSYAKSLDIFVSPLSIFDFGSVLLALCRFYPLQVALSQRSSFPVNVVGANFVIFHLLRSVQLSIIRSLGCEFRIDFCESLSNNFYKRASFLRFFSLRRYVFIVESVLLRICEFRFRKYPGVIITKNDALFQMLDDCHVVPNVSNVVERQWYTPTSSSILFIGHVDYEPNLQGLIILAQWIEVAKLNFVIDVVGRYSEATEALLRRFDCLNLLGFVDDIGSLHGNYICGVCYTPLATGLQNKVFDYIRLGLPIVCSSNLKTDFSGIDAVYFCEDVCGFSKILKNLARYD